MEIILASASPRRRELLQLVCPAFGVCPADTDETLRAGEAPASEAERLSLDKARAAFTLHPQAACIGSDTMVTIDDRVLGKPRDAAEAEAMLRQLRGREHRVITGLALLLPGGEEKVLHTETCVHFRAFSEVELQRYLATGEPMDKAGAYGIQGHGALLISGIDGDYYSVMGLPVAKLYELLQQYHVLEE